MLPLRVRVKVQPSECHSIYFAKMAHSGEKETQFVHENSTAFVSERAELTVERLQDEWGNDISVDTMRNQIEEFKVSLPHAKGKWKSQGNCLTYQYVTSAQGRHQLTIKHKMRNIIHNIQATEIMKAPVDIKACKINISTETTNYEFSYQDGDEDKGFISIRAGENISVSILLYDVFGKKVSHPLKLFYGSKIVAKCNISQETVSLFSNIHTEDSHQVQFPCIKLCKTGKHILFLDMSEAAGLKCQPKQIMLPRELCLVLFSSSPNEGLTSQEFTVVVNPGEAHSIILSQDSQTEGYLHKTGISYFGHQTVTNIKEITDKWGNEISLCILLPSLQIERSELIEEGKSVANYRPEVNLKEKSIYYTSSQSGCFRLKIYLGNKLLNTNIPLVKVRTPPLNQKSVLLSLKYQGNTIEWFPFKNSGSNKKSIRAGTELDVSVKCGDIFNKAWRGIPPVVEVKEERKISVQTTLKGNITTFIFHPFYYESTGEYEIRVQFTHDGDDTLQKSSSLHLSIQPEKVQSVEMQIHKTMIYVGHEADIKYRLKLGHDKFGNVITPLPVDFLSEIELHASNSQVKTRMDRQNSLFMALAHGACTFDIILSCNGEIISHTCPKITAKVPELDPSLCNWKYACTRAYEKAGQNFDPIIGVCHVLQLDLKDETGNKWNGALHDHDLTLQYSNGDNEIFSLNSETRQLSFDPKKKGQYSLFIYNQCVSTSLEVKGLQCYEEAWCVVRRYHGRLEIVCKKVESLPGLSCTMLKGHRYVNLTNIKRLTNVYIDVNNIIDGDNDDDDDDYDYDYDYDYDNDDDFDYSQDEQEYEEGEIRIILPEDCTDHDASNVRDVLVLFLKGRHFRYAASYHEGMRVIFKETGMEAYNQNDHMTAKCCKQIKEAHAELMSGAHDIACENLFNFYNKGRDLDTIDLHEMRAYRDSTSKEPGEAIDKLKKRLDDKDVENKRNWLEIIVGAGHHSEDNIQRVAPLVKKHLNQRNLNFITINKGSLLIEFWSYTGSEPCLGEYYCQKCDNHWKSIDSWKNCWQKCHGNNCGNKCMPFKQRTPDLVPPVRGVSHSQHPRPRHGLDLSSCQKCLSLGRNCRSYRT